MVGIIRLIAWFVFIVHFLALIGCIGLARYLLNSSITWLGALVAPEETKMFCRQQIRNAVVYAKWTIGSAVVLMLLYL